MEFTADSLRLDILELARTGNKLLSVAGRPDWMCQAVEVADPITFTTPDTVLVSHFSLHFSILWATFFFSFCVETPEKRPRFTGAAQNLSQTLFTTTPQE